MIYVLGLFGILAGWVMLRILGGEREAQLRVMKARVQREQMAEE